MAGQYKTNIWGNRRRIRKLKEFHTLIDCYYRNLVRDWDGTLCESTQAIQARSAANDILDEIHGYLCQADVNPVGYCTPPPAIGGYAKHVDVIYNVFRIHKYDMPHVEVLDMVERAIGIYKRDYLGAWIRTFSPFHWLNELIAFVAGIPFNLLVSAGVNRSKVESNTLARLVKGTFFFLGALITYIGGVLAIADKLGYLGQVKAYIRALLR